MPVNYITEDPAIAEFNRANKVADEETQRDIANKSAAFNLQQSQAEGPLKLRAMTAAAQTAEAKAPYAGQEAAADLAAKRASTASTISGMNNAQARLHMEAFTKSMDALDQGDVEGAKRISQSVGDQLPDQVIQNSQMRAAIKAITAQAQQLYPNRPKDQMAYIHAHIGELASRAQSGQAIEPQTAPYRQAPGAPEIPETSINPHGQGETERIISNLQADYKQRTGKDLSYQDAVALAKRAPNGDQMTLRRETLALDAAKADPNYASDPQGTLSGWRQRYGLPAMAGQQGAAPQRPPTVPEGSAYSPSRNMWRDPQGNLYDANGQRVAPAQASAPPAPPQPTPPRAF